MIYGNIRRDHREVMSYQEAPLQKTETIIGQILHYNWKTM